MVAAIMILRFSSWLTGLALAVLTVGLLFPHMLAGAEKQQARKIEFYDPKSSDSTTNFNQLNPKRGGLRDLEDDLTKSFQKGFSSHSSLDGVVMPPPSR